METSNNQTNNQTTEALPKRWLSIADLTEYCGIGRDAQAKMRRRKDIPFCKIGNKIMYDINVIDTWIEQHKVAGVQ